MFDFTKDMSTSIEDLLPVFEAVNLVPIGAFKSIFSICGILLFLISIIIILKLKFPGFVIVFLIFIFMAFTVAADRPFTSSRVYGEDLDPFTYNAPYFIRDNTWINEVEAVTLDRWYAVPPEGTLRYYRVHVKNGIPWWAFHPDGFWWGPALALMIGAIIRPHYFLFFFLAFLGGKE